MPGLPFQPPISTGIYLLLIVVGFARWGAGARLPQLTPGARRVLVTFAVFGVVAATSLIGTRTTMEGMQMWVKVVIFPMIAAAAVIALTDDLKRTHAVLATILAAAVVASLYGIWEGAAGYNPLIDAFPSDLVYFRSEILGDLAYRSFSVYGNPIEYGTCVGIAAVYALIRFAAATGARDRLLFGAATMICYLGIMSSFSRGPMLSLLIVTFVIALIYRDLRRWLLWGLAASAAGLAAAWPFIGPGLIDRLRDFDNVTLRFKLWETAAALFQDHPVRGVGIGNFPEYYLEWIRLHRIGPFYEFGEDSVATIRVAEQTYLQLAAETGLIGIAAAIAFTIAVFGLGLRLARHAIHPDRRDLAIVVMGGIVVWGLNGMFITAYTHFFGSMLALGVFPALLCAMDIQDKSRATEPSNPPV